MKVFQGNAERGRTMLEIIMVIAIASILIYIGIHQWRAVRSEARANAVMQQLVAMKSARQTGLREHPYDPMFRAEEGPYGVMLSIRNGAFNESNKDFYWINVVAVDEGFRDALVRLGRERLDPCLVRNSQTEVTFYFPKFKSKLYVDEGTGPDKDIEPDIPQEQDCQNGGHWNDYTYKCDCPSGWVGLACDRRDPCYEVECGEHGSCEEGSCVCTDNYYGDNCENAPLVCENGGTWNTTTNECDCPNGYVGTTCENRGCTVNLDCSGVCEGCFISSGENDGICQDMCQRVGYLESTGTQWINTGLVLSSNQVVYEWQAQDNEASSSTSLFGAEYSPTFQSSDRVFSGVLYGKKNSRSAYLGSSSSISLGYVSSDDGFHTWSWVINSDHTTYLVKDGIALTTKSWTGDLNKTTTVRLFANLYCNGGTTQKTRAKFRYFRIRDNGTLVRDFVPVLAPDKGQGKTGVVPAMLDQVNNKVYYNAGSGTFSYGS